MVLTIAPAFLFHHLSLEFHLGVGVSHLSTQPHNLIRVRVSTVKEAIRKGLASFGVTKLKIVVAFLQVGLPGRM